MLRLPKPCLRVRFQLRLEKLRHELEQKYRLIKCRRALARSIADMEREAKIEDYIIWEEKK